MNSFKSLSLLASAVFFSSLATISYAQGNPPGNPGETELLEGLTDPLPTHLHHGVNLDGIYQSDWQYMKSRPCYDERRLDDMLNSHDFQMIAEAGFDHVRIPISPVAFGVHDQTGAVDVNYVFTRSATDTGFDSNWPVGYHINAHENFEALAADIIAAQEVGLEIIIDCHPWLVSQHHYDLNWEMGASTKPPSGTFLENFCTAPTVPALITQNHPLPKFWDTFLHELRLALEVAENPRYNEGNVFRGIHFEVLNEPMVNFWGKYSDGSYGPLTSAQYGQTNDHAVFDAWKFDQLANWKVIQARAVRAIYENVNPDESRVIVSTLTSLVDSYGVQKRQPLVPGTPTYQFTPYIGADMTAIGTSMTNARRVIYSYHPYLPFAYTHNEKLSDGLNRTYRKLRDYYDNFLSPYTSFLYNDNILEEGDPLDPSRKRALPYIVTWRTDNEGPAMLATEFGSIHREATVYAVDQPPPGNNTGLRPVTEFERDKYLYDMRRAIELQGGGWSVFGYTSTWGVTARGVYLQRFNTSETPIFHRSDTRDGNAVFDTSNLQALFGDSRPVNNSDD